MSTSQRERVTIRPTTLGAIAESPSEGLIRSMINRLTDLAIRREVWESTEYDRSNQVLYALIAECLQLYHDLTTGEQASLMKQGLRDYIHLKGYSFKDSSPLSFRVLRCVFGDRDRRRLSTYHTVLRAAISDKWAVADVASKITAYGGVQEISIRRANGLTAKDKAIAAEAALMGQSIATITSAAILSQFNTEHCGEKAVALLTLNDDGSYQVHCIVRSNAAVTATLAGYYSANREMLNEMQDQRAREANDEAMARLITDAADAANDAQASDVA